MKVALDISPTRTGHKVRGIGAYTLNLADQLKKDKWGIDFVFFDKPDSPPPADIIHYPYFDFFTRSLPYQNVSKRVVTIHDVIPLVFPKHFPPGFIGSINLVFQKRALNNCQAIICDSLTSKNDIVNKLSQNESKVHTVYLAPSPNAKKTSDTKTLESVARKFNLPSKFVLYVGDVNWNKNINGLLEAAKISGVNLVMVGQALVEKNLSQTRQIDDKIKYLSLETKVIRTGFVSSHDLVAIYNLASVTVLPSHYEGFGLPVLESMACGTPVVCSNVSSLAEIAGNLAIFCDPNNPASIAEKINVGISINNYKRDKLSEKLIKHASSFSWSKVAAQTIEVYKLLAP